MGATALTEELDRDLRERHDLSLVEYEVMVRLSESPQRALRMADLADSVQNSRSRMTHTIARMEREGLVVRRSCPSDRRGVLAVLTDSGHQKLVESAPDHVASVRAGLIDVVDADDLAVLGRALGEVLAHLTPERWAALNGSEEADDADTGCDPDADPTLVAV
jgi:DNA-binding MarR family transcriptional regulator